MNDPHVVAAIKDGDIHLWWLDLHACPGDPSTLSDEETARAQRFRFAVHRERFLAAHAAVRAILGRYLDIPPASIRFTTAAGGKPALDAVAHGPSSPAFNLSHSGSHGALAIARSGSIGVDLEVAKEDPRPENMLGLLAPQERAAARHLDARQLSDAFHIAWTRKEACLKAIGCGFAVQPQLIDVGIEAGVRAVALGPVIATMPDAGLAIDPRPVHVLTLHSPSGIPTSVARVGDPIARIQRFQYPTMAGQPLEAVSC
jgi:4'-phosphopantetheinyl transferase